MILCMVLLFGTMSQAIANDGMHLEEVSATQAVKPIAYTHDFDGYGNVVGVLNSDGTKTAYLFSSLEQAEGVDSVTGLVSTQEERLQRNSFAQSRGINQMAIEDASVYSANSTQNFGVANVAMIGEDDTLGYGRLYMKIDLSPLLLLGVAYTDILSASLHFAERTEIAAGNRNVLQAYLVSGEWEENSITWATKPDYYGFEMIGCANVCFDDYSDEVLTQRIYITKAVMAWLQGLDNNGIMLKEKDDEGTNRFVTTESIDVEKWPYVTVTYSDEEADQWGQGIVNNGSYYIMNKETGRFLTAASTVVGTSVTNQEFRDDYAETQRWKFTMVGTSAGYIVELDNSNVSVCLKLPSSGQGNNIVLGATSTRVTQIWKPTRNWNGTYHFKTKATSGMAFGADEWNSNVLQVEYACNLNHYDEWTLIPVNKGTASFFDFDIDIDTTYGTETMTDMASSIGGYGSATRITNSTIDGIDEIIKNSGLFYFAGHGEEGRLCFYTNRNVIDGHLVVSDELKNPDYPNDISMENWPFNSLAQSQLIVLNSCLSGADALDSAGAVIDENMTGRLYWLGAHNVVSHYQLITSDDSDAWKSAFMTNVLLGRSLKTAKMRADNHMYDDYFVDVATGPLLRPFGNTNEHHDLGDETYIPGFSVASALARQNYVYQDFPMLTFEKCLGDSTGIIEENNVSVNNRFSLPKDAIIDNSAFCNGNTFDVYMDEYGGIYWYYEGTNVLHSYEPYTEELKLGDVVVDPLEAMQLANEFLATTGYNVTGYQVKTSNEFSKNYSIEFHSPTERKKLVFHMQADIYGVAYINSFSAYVGDYGNY